MLHVLAGANSFAEVEKNIASRPAASYGTAVTPAVGSKGSWTQIFSALANDTYGLLICINNNRTSASSRNSVLDVGIGAASSEILLIADIISGNANPYTLGGLWYYFPVAIPAGTRVAVRAQGTVTTSFRVYIQAMQKPMNPSVLKKASYTETIGMTAPQGTAITAGTGSEGAWTLLGTTTRRLWFWQVGLQVSSADTAHQNAVVHVDLAEGDGTNFNFLLRDVVFVTASSEGATLTPLTLASEVPVDPGTSIYARSQTSGNVDPTFIAAYGAGG